MNRAFFAPAFGLGLLATMAPCVLPLYPGFIAYLASTGDRLRGRAGARFLGLFVLAGVLVMMLALAAIIVALRVAAGQVLAFVTPVADLVVIGLGVLLFGGLNPFSRLPKFASLDTTRGPYINAFGYGLLHGPIALPCSGPLVLSVFTLCLGIPRFFQHLLFFLIFWVGFRPSSRDPTLSRQGPTGLASAPFFAQFFSDQPSRGGDPDRRWCVGSMGKLSVPSALSCTLTLAPGKNLGLEVPV